MGFAEILEHDFVTVTETSARAAAQTMGYGDVVHCDKVAAEAMRAALDQLEIAGRVVIGEDEHNGPQLSAGEEVGVKGGDGKRPSVDIAADPLEGARLCATGAPGALSVLAAAERGGLLRAPDVHMEKLIVGPIARGRIHLDAPVPENLRNIASAFGREVTDLTVVVLDRERHGQLVADIRAAGARIRLIDDGDLQAGIASAVRGSGVHAVMGVGGGPEGVLAAAAARCLGGEVQARFRPVDDDEARQLAEAGFDAVDRIYSTEELVPGEEIVFSATGVTDGELLRGVRFFGGGHRTSTLLISLPSRVVRFLDTLHQEDPSCPVYLH